MVVTIFRSRLNPGVEEEINRIGTRMFELAASMPGFVSYSEYVSADGENVTIVEFESHETLATWRAHPEHRQAQQQGKERFFSEYRITICEGIRDYTYKAEATSAVRQ